MKAVEFFLPKQRDEKIKELETEIERLNNIISDAKKDVKRLLKEDYETKCELCARYNCCFLINSWDCKRYSRWRGSPDYGDDGKDI